MTKVKLCPITGLRFRITKQSAWESETGRDRRIFSFEVSTGNRNCSGEPLRLQMNWAREHADRFEFSLGDTRRVHNYVSVGHPEFGVLGVAEAEAVARSEGDAWIQANHANIEAMLGQSEHRIVRWDDWKVRPEYGSYLAQLEACFARDATFRTVVRHDLSTYLTRQKRQGRSVGPPSDPRALDRLAQYLLEELAVYAIQAERRTTVNVYPGGQMSVFKRMAEFKSVPKILTRRHFAYLEIK